MRGGKNGGDKEASQLFGWQNRSPPHKPCYAAEYIHVYEAGTNF